MISYFCRKTKNAFVKLENKWQCYKNRRPLRNRDFSIISNNCWGGLVSQHYGLPYMSPTCGLLINGGDYIKFCKNIRFYLTQKLQFIPFESAKYAKEYLEIGPFPVAMLGDIEVYFMHYPTEEDAAKKWYRRAKRINWNNIIFKLSHRESFTDDDIKAFAKLDIPNKLIIAEKDCGDTTITIPGISTYIGDETPLIFENMDVTAYLNSILDK